MRMDRCTDGRWTAIADGGWTAALMEDGEWTAALMEDGPLR